MRAPLLRAAGPDSCLRSKRCAMPVSRPLFHGMLSVRFTEWCCCVSVPSRAFRMAHCNRKTKRTRLDAFQGCAGCRVVGRAITGRAPTNARHP
eukprot:628947-Rhodomonas_salina.2